jgi:hypothetical protein
MFASRITLTMDMPNQFLQLLTEYCVPQLLTNRNQRFTLTGVTKEDADAWYKDIKNIVDATKNWETAGQVALGVGAAVAMALVAGLAGSAAGGGKRHR